MIKKFPLVPDEEVKSLCKIGSGPTTCRFLALGRDGFECAKHTLLALTINAMVENGEMTAVGDNCEGKRNDEDNG